MHTKELKDAELLKVIDTTTPDINEYFHIFGRVLGWVREKWIKKYLREVSLLLIAGLIQILVALIIKLIG